MKTAYALFLLFILSCLAIGSCSKKNGPADPRDKIVGRYVGRDSSISITTFHPYSRPSQLVSADSSVKTIEIEVSKGGNDTIYVSYNKSVFPSSFVYNGNSYRFYLSLGSESYTSRSLQFSEDATSLSIIDTTIGVSYSGHPDRPDATRHYGRSYIYTTRQ